MTNCFIGLDLGQARDYSALAVIERRWLQDDGVEVPVPMYHVIHLERSQMSYPTLIQHVVQLLKMPKLLFESVLVVDAGGPGRPVIDMLRAQGVRNMRGVVITGGAHVGQSPDGTTTIPKRDLVAALVVQYEQGRIKMSPELPLAEQFEAELTNFSYKIDVKRGRETYEAADENVHDDMVVAAALAVYWATQVEKASVPGGNHRSYVAKAYDPLGRK
jgi:hypothetical protein